MSYRINNNLSKSVSVFLNQQTSQKQIPKLKLKCASNQSSRVGFGAFVQQYFGHAMMPAVCCHMQRGEVVQSDVINLCVVLQELLDAVHVIPLS